MPTVILEPSSPPTAPAAPAVHASGATSLPAGRFLSEAECQALIARVRGFAQGGGATRLYVVSRWMGNLRWARNAILSSGDVRTTQLNVHREIRGAEGMAQTDALDDRRLRWAVARAERGLEREREVPDVLRGEPPFRETFPRPRIWSESTYKQNAAERAELMHELVKPAQAAGMLAAGYLEMTATGQSRLGGEQAWYYPYTWARYTVTVRAPDGSGSGWAGVDHWDWGKIDAVKLSQIALEKCLMSRNPVRLEPGRYTTILEPQAVGDLVTGLFSPYILDRIQNERQLTVRRSDPRYKKNPQFIFNDGPGYSKLGERVIDARLSITTDCTDPDLGFPPFDEWTVYTPVPWITDGVLTELRYNRDYAVKQLGRDTGGMPQFGYDDVPAGLGTGAFRMSVKGEITSVEEMIATTKRGLVVTRFYDVRRPRGNIGDLALTQGGYTRDGLWLVENGKISKSVKNFHFTESPLFVLNNVEQAGVPQRIFNQGWPRALGYPMVVPALKVRDFSFTSLSDAI